MSVRLWSGAGNLFFLFLVSFVGYLVLGGVRCVRDAVAVEHEAALFLRSADVKCNNEGNHRYLCRTTAWAVAYRLARCDVDDDRRVTCVELDP